MRLVGAKIIGMNCVFLPITVRLFTISIGLLLQMYRDREDVKMGSLFFNISLELENNQFLKL